MITETGKIIDIKEVQGEKVVQVECISKSSCSGCSSSSNCGVGSVSEAFTDKKHYFEIPYEEGMKVEHTVELQISNSDLIKSASLVYLLPLIFFISSALLIKSFFNVNEMVVIATSSAFAGLGFIVTRVIAKKLFPNKQSNPLISSKIAH